MKHRSPLLASIVAFGYALLYVPIISVVIYSFNDSRLVTLWGGFSLRWYASLLHDDKLLAAAFLSLRIAFVSATVATALGAIVALALHRVARLRGRLLLSGMITAPLVMPEIITGLSLLFLFISMANLIGWPMNRGATTITIAHITFSMAYVVVVVRSRLSPAWTTRSRRPRWTSAAGRSPCSSTSRCRCCCRRWCPAGCCRSRCRSTTS